jgi:murein endopeptidase
MSDYSEALAKAKAQSVSMTYWQARDAMLAALAAGDDQTVAFIAEAYPAVTKNLAGMAKNEGALVEPE